METILKILEKSSLWEYFVLIIVGYLIFRPDLINRITKLKMGNIEFELSEIKKEINDGKEKLSKLESEIESEKKLFDELLEKFKADSSLKTLKPIKNVLKSRAKNSTDIEILRKYLNPKSSAEELFTTAVSIREKRPPELFPDIIKLLDDLSEDEYLGGFRLNTIWTLTSSIHKILISCIRDNLKPFPTSELLDKAELTLKKLESNQRVISNRPDNPMKGIRGPIKHSLTWIKKAKKIKIH